MKDERTLGEKVSDSVASFGGSWKFIICFSIFLSLWITINSLAIFSGIAFDAQPFILLNLILSFVASFQAPFIMMSQNRASKIQDKAYRELFAELQALIQSDMKVDKHSKEEMYQIKREIRELKRLIEQQKRG